MKHRSNYLDDDDFRGLQNLLMLHPEAGDSIPGTGGLRKLRFATHGVARVKEAACE
jgi:hypothetical protein